MRRIAFLAITVALILGVASPSMAVRPAREWDDPSRAGERGTGASGDDDVPSKEQQVEPSFRLAPEQVIQERIQSRQRLMRFLQHIRLGIVSAIANSSKSVRQISP